MLHLIDLKKIPILKEEIKAGFNYLKREIDAVFTKDKVDEVATKWVVDEKKKEIAYIDFESGAITVVSLAGAVFATAVSGPVGGILYGLLLKSPSIKSEMHKSSLVK